MSGQRWMKSDSETLANEKATSGEARSDGNRFATKLADLDVRVFKRLTNDRLCARQALAAAAAQGELGTHLMQGLRASGNRLANGLVGHVVADADDHG